MKFKTIHLILLFMGLVLGFILSTQFRLHSEIAASYPPAQERTAALLQELEEDRQSRDELQHEVSVLRNRLDQAAAGPELAKMRTELDQVRQLAGMTNMEGPGVQLTLNDNPNALPQGMDPNNFVLHDEDVLSVLNELKAAGATAIAINEQRVISTTEVRCIGPTILLNKNQRLSPPFVIFALGEPDTLTNAMKMKGGVIDSLLNWGIQVDIKKVEKVKIPAYSGALTYNYAKPK
ncbi:MAG: DUF881 domain-containing protein [Firmicutes bacterium]|nr:DUF881 domain-containing protein [Bacillota bacterium]